MKSDEEGPEMDFPDYFIKCFPGEFWPSEAESSKHGKNNRVEYRAMEVHHDEIGISDVEVERRRGEQEQDGAQEGGEGRDQREGADSLVVGRSDSLDHNRAVPLHRR